MEHIGNYPNRGLPYQIYVVYPSPPPPHARCCDAPDGILTMSSIISNPNICPGSIADSFRHLFPGAYCANLHHYCHRYIIRFSAGLHFASYLCLSLAHMFMNRRSILNICALNKVELCQARTGILY